MVFPIKCYTYNMTVASISSFDNMVTISSDINMERNTLNIYGLRFYNNTDKRLVTDKVSTNVIVVGVIR